MKKYVCIALKNVMPEKKTVQNLEMGEKLRDVFLAGHWVGGYLIHFQRIIQLQSGLS